MSSVRSRLFKNANKDADELRRRRQDQSLELRKQKKDEQLQKRRNISVKEPEEVDNNEEINKENSIIDFDGIVAAMTNPDNKKRSEAIQVCRKILSRAKNPPIEEFFNRNAVKILIDNLHGPEDVVFEAAWALTNIASGESKHTLSVVKLGGIRHLVKLLDHPNDAIAEQSIWALGNIAGDCANLRDLVINDGVVEPAIKFLYRVMSKPSMVSNVAWMLSNLCRNKNPSPPKSVIIRLLPVLKELLQYPSSSNVIVDTAWALAYASDSANNYIEEILNSGCIPLLIGLLSTGQTTIVSPSLRAIGNIVIGSDDQTQKVLDYGLLSHIPSLLNSPKSLILKEACWMLSNVTAGTIDQISAVINYNIIPSVLRILQEVQKEACWVISNMISGGTKEHCEYLVSQDVIKVLSGMLNVSDPKVVQMIIEAYSKLFAMASESGPDMLEKYCIELENCNGLDTMERLQDHENVGIYSAAYDFIAKFFSDENCGDTDPALQEEVNTDIHGKSAVDEFNFDSSHYAQQSSFDF